MKLVVMVPAYNEECTVGEVIKRIPRNVEGIDKVEVLIVDDGSTDRTVEEAEKAGADKVISHSFNKGVGAAFSTGLRTALEEGGDIIVNIDADGQFDPQDISRIVKPIVSGEADVAIASRFLDKSLKPDMPWIKKVGNNIFTRLITRMAKVRLTDTQCGFRALSKEAAMRCVLFSEYTYTQEVLLNVARKGFRIKEIPIQVYRRRHGKSRVVSSWFSYGFRVTSIIFRSYCDMKPLTVFGLMSFLVFLGSMVPFTYVFSYYLEFHKIAGVIELALLASFLFLTSLIIFSFGILGDMFKRQRLIQEEILYYNKRRLYVNVDG